MIRYPAAIGEDRLATACDPAWKTRPCGQIRSCDLNVLPQSVLRQGKFLLILPKTCDCFACLFVKLFALSLGISVLVWMNCALKHELDGVS